MALIRLDRNGDMPKAAPGVAVPLPAQIGAEAPDETWCMIDRHGWVVGCVSLWWRHTAVRRGRRTGFFGHFSSAGRPVSGVLLKHALERLHAEGCDLAAGPINGSTWYTYRLVTDPGTGPDFPLDVRTPPDWCDDFRAAGLAELETYCSVSLGRPSDLGIDFDEHARHVAGRGLRIRAADLNAPDRDLFSVWSLSMRCFSANPFFTPICEQEFFALYRPFVGLMDSNYVLLAEDALGLCGFHFAFPWELPDGRRCVVSKTMAVHPRMRGTGLGSHLLRRILAQASSDHAAEFIMAFMHDDNLSARWARRHGEVIRRYAVFGRGLI